jgi:hypothetical protein
MAKRWLGAIRKLSWLVAPYGEVGWVASVEPGGVSLYNGLR